MRPKMRIWKRLLLLVAGFVLPACGAYPYADKSRAIGEEWRSLTTRGRLVPGSADPMQRLRFYDDAETFGRDLDELARGGVAPASTSVAAGRVR